MKSKLGYRLFPLPTGWLLGMLLATLQAGAVNFHNDLERAFPTEPGGKLVIQADRGTIDIITGADKIEIKVVREVTGGTQSQADEIFNNHVVTFAQEGATFSVIAKDKKQRSWSRGDASYNVRYEVKLPSRFDLDLKTSGGDIKANDLDGWAKARTSSGSITFAKVTGKMEAENSGGNISIASVGGDLTARTSSGSIHVKQVVGKTEASNSGGDIRVDEVGGKLQASTSSGSIQLATVKGDIEVKNSGGGIKIGSAGGKVSASTSSGLIQIDSVAGTELSARNSGGAIHIGRAEGTVKVQTSSGAIKVERVKGKLEARNSGGEISVGSAQGEVMAETTSGPIKIKSAEGKVILKNSGGSIGVDQAEMEITASTSSGAIEIGRAKGRVEVRNSGGQIRVRNAAAAVVAATSSGMINVGFSEPPMAESRLEVSGGGITVVLPKSAALNVDARSSGGNVSSELPLTVEGQFKQGALQGKLNGGGPLIYLRSSSGDIQLKAAPIASALTEETPKSR